MILIHAISYIIQTILIIKNLVTIKIDLVASLLPLIKKKACLGQWECDLKDDEYITEFVCGGAKSYAYKTSKGKINIRQKGITLDVANNKIITFDTFKKMVLNSESIKTAERFQFKTNPQKDISTVFVSRSVRCTIDSKRQVSNHDTFPFGYVEV